MLLLPSRTSLRLLTYVTYYLKCLGMAKRRDTTVCLLPHCGYLSETSRMLAIRRALLERGASVCLATHGGTHERLLQQSNT